MKFIKSALIFFNIMIVYYFAFALNVLISMFRFGWNEVYLIRILLATFMIAWNVLMRNNIKRFIAANERNEQNEEAKKVE